MYHGVKKILVESISDSGIRRKRNYDTIHNFTYFLCDVDELNDDSCKKKTKRAKDVFRNVPVTNIDYNYTQLHTTTQIQARLIIASLSIYTFLALIILEDSCNIIGSKKQLMQLQTPLIAIWVLIDRAEQATYLPL